MTRRSGRRSRWRSYSRLNVVMGAKQIDGSGRKTSYPPLLQEREGNGVGVFTEYLGKKWSMDELAVERKAQLARISALRERDVLVYAADLEATNAPTSLDYSDLVPIQDQLSNLDGTAKLDIILETGGGSAEVAEDIVRLVHAKYDEVNFIIPGWAKSAGTIMAMAGDEILMEPGSALGPIDA